MQYSTGDKRNDGVAILWNRQTSGWNCCSVLVWQYWHPSAPSHLLGSPHSSLCFTAGHGSALRQRQKRNNALEQKKTKQKNRLLYFLTGGSNTCICAWVGCASCLCCCGSTDRHNLDGTGEVAFYRVLFCSVTARSFGLWGDKAKKKEG